VLRSQERETVLKVVNYIKSNYPKESASLFTNETVQATGISRASVFKVHAENAHGILVSPRNNEQEMK
jgi:hypothetical protein